MLNPFNFDDSMSCLSYCFLDVGSTNVANACLISGISTCADELSILSGCEVYNFSLYACLSSGILASGVTPNTS